MANYDRTAATWEPTPVTPDAVPALQAAITAGETKIVALRAMLKAVEDYRLALPGISADWKVAGRTLMRAMGREWYDDNLLSYCRDGLGYGPRNDVDTSDVVKQVSAEIEQMEMALRNLRSLLP